jgi:hypothetical protein
MADTELSETALGLLVFDRHDTDDRDLSLGETTENVPIESPQVGREQHSATMPRGNRSE